MMDYEQYFKHCDYDEEEAYTEGFCPFTRKVCMGSDCQLGVFFDGIFYGCGLDRSKVYVRVGEE